MFIGQSISASPVTGFGLFILETVAALAIIALGAWALVRFSTGRLRQSKGTSRMRVVERLALEPKHSLYLIEIDGTALLIGVSEGAIRVLKTADQASLAILPQTPKDAL